MTDMLFKTQLSVRNEFSRRLGIRREFARLVINFEETHGYIIAEALAWTKHNITNKYKYS